MSYTPKLFIIVQARISSTRLPKKVILPLCDRTVLETMFERLSPLKEHLYIATTNDGTEDAIVELCNKNSIPVYRGDRDNVLQRYYDTASEFGATDEDIIVRLTSDCPFIDPTIVAEVITLLKEGNYDYASNCIERTYPRGFDTEVFRFKTLKHAFENASTTFEREHVTTYIHTTHKEKFKLGSFTDSTDRSRYRLTLDEQDDYDMTKALYKALGCRYDFSYDELISVLEANPQIAQMNLHVEQKKV